MAGIVYPLMDEKLEAAEPYSYTLPAVASLLALALWGWWFYRKRASVKLAQPTKSTNNARMVSVLCVLAFVNLAVFARGFVLKAQLDSYKEPAALIMDEGVLGPDDVVASYKEPVQGLGFYLGRRIVLVDVLGELEFGALQEKDPRWFIDSRSLEALWGGEKRVFLVAEKSRLEELMGLLGENNVIQWGQTRTGVVLSNF
jgi:hypothetical protein